MLGCPESIVVFIILFDPHNCHNQKYLQMFWRIRRIRNGSKSFNKDVLTLKIALAVEDR